MHTPDGKSIRLEMGRPRSAMTALVNERQSGVREHIWKLIAYWASRPRDIDGWLTTLNAFISKARTFNIPVGKSGANMSLAQLIHAITDVSFDSPDDAVVLAGEWHNAGFPPIPESELEGLRHQCIDLSNRACALIMVKGGPDLTRADVEVSRSRRIDDVT